MPARLSFVHYLGALALLFFPVQVLTGILLMIYYRPSVGAAHWSTAIIADEVSLGWLVRSLHYWGSELLILLGFLHMVRVYFSRAYQAPRELSWIIGACLLGSVVALAFTGTLLPWDQYAYWYTDSARDTISGIPLVGTVLLGVMWGGWQIGEAVLLRFYVLHVGVLPWVAVILLSLHFLMIWYFGIQEPPRSPADERTKTRPFVPDFLINLFVAFVLVGGGLLSVAVLWPPALLEPADPVAPLAHVIPPWYLAALRGILRGLPAAAAATTVVAIVASVLLVPLLDRSPVYPLWKKIVHRGLGLLMIAAWTFLAVQGYRR